MSEETSEGNAGGLHFSGCYGGHNTLPCDWSVAVRRPKTRSPALQRNPCDEAAASGVFAALGTAPSPWRSGGHTSRRQAKSAELHV